MRKNAIAIVAVALTLLTISGCAGGPNTGSNGCGGTNATCVAPEFLFATTTQNQLVSFRVNPETGTLSSPVSTIGSPGDGFEPPNQGIVSLAHEGLVYVADPGKDQIDGYAVNSSTGVLTPLLGSPFMVLTPGGMPGFIEGITADPQGKFLYVTDFGMQPFSIDSSTGALVPVTRISISQVPSVQLVVDPSGKFLYVSGFGASAFTIDSKTGALGEVAGSPCALPVFGSMNTAAITVDATGHFVYVVADATPGGPGYVIGCATDGTTGFLTPIPETPVFSRLLSPFAIATSGNFLYVRGPQGIDVFSIAQSTGILTEISGSPFLAGSADDGMAVSPDGNFLYEAGADGVSVFAINRTSGAIKAVGIPAATPSPALQLSIYRPSL